MTSYAMKAAMAGDDMLSPRIRVALQERVAAGFAGEEELEATLQQSGATVLPQLVRYLIAQGITPDSSDAEIQSAMQDPGIISMLLGATGLAQSALRRSTPGAGL
jgi:hypothetical protein